MSNRRLLAALAMLPLFDALPAFAAFPLVLGVANAEASQAADATQTAAAFALVVGIASALVVLCAALAVVWSLRERVLGGSRQACSRISR